MMNQMVLDPSPVLYGNHLIPQVVGHMVQLLKRPVGLISNFLKVLDEMVETVYEIRWHCKRGCHDGHVVAHHKIIALTAFHHVLPQPECLIHNDILVAVAGMASIRISYCAMESMDQISQVIEGRVKIPCQREG